MSNFFASVVDTLIDKLFPTANISDTSLMRKMAGSQTLLKNNNSLFPNIPFEYHQELIENSLFSADFNLSSNSKMSNPNLHSIFRTLNPGSSNLTPKFSPVSYLMQEYINLFSSPLKMVVDKNLDNIWDSASNHTMSKSDPKGSLSDQLVESFTKPVMPITKTQINVIVSKKSDPEVLSKKECYLNQQMTDRKTKEIQKRSRKRRRRQKKVNVNVNLSSNSNEKTKKSLSTAEVSVSPKSKNKNHSIVCDVSISHNSNSLQITLPNISSFLVTVESGGDEDSDWDTADADWAVDDSEFQVCGLLMASLSTTSFCANTIVENFCDNEQKTIRRRLKEINHSWNESTKHLEEKEKSASLVSFASDGKLVEIFPVGMYDRKGEWEIYATERLRFRKRISELEDILSPCLSPKHRDKVYNNLQKTNL